jgi:hypothetical protein
VESTHDVEICTLVPTTVYNTVLSLYSDYSGSADSNEVPFSTFLFLFSQRLGPLLLLTPENPRGPWHFRFKAPPTACIEKTSSRPHFHTRIVNIP